MYTPIGLVNTGNSCYLNAGLQMLLQNMDFCEIVLKKRHINNNMEEFAKFIEIYRNSPVDDSLIPRIVKNIVGARHEIFRGNKQQDSQEFIISLMDILNEYTDNAFINLFQIDSKYVVKCKLRICLEKSETPAVDNFLMVPIEPKNLDNCYKKYKNHEKLEDENKYYCENCKAERIASTRIVVTSWPKHLVVFLSRFINNGETSVKIDTPINIPILWRHGYTIQGCIIHSGHINGGHYRYISRIKENGSVCWYNCDDSSVDDLSEIDAMKIIKKKGYIVYYKKDV